MRVHKQAVTRQKNKLNKRISGVTNPDELTGCILEIATELYRGGKRVVEFPLNIPTENFISWANEAKIGSKDNDHFDRDAIHGAIVKIVQRNIDEQLLHGVYAKIESMHTSKHRLGFKVRISLINPKPTPSEE